MREGKNEAEDLRAAVAALVDHFRYVWDEARLHLFRQYLQVTINSATPLLSRMTEAKVIDVASSMWSLRPPPHWPSGPAFNRGSAAFGDLSAHECLRTGHRPQDHLIEVRRNGHSDGGLLLRISRYSVELSCQIDGHPLRSLEGKLYLRLPHELPDVVAAAAIGRPLFHLVEHPWFVAPDWKVLRTRSAGRGTWVVVATGSEPFEMPWFRLLPTPSGASS